MDRRVLYRALIRLMPGGPRRLTPVTQSLADKQVQAYQAILKRHRAQGGALALFDLDGVSDHFVYGQARKGLPVDGKTAFRLASVSKMVSAAGILLMRQAGLIDLDADADTSLPYSLRHPGAPEKPVTLRMLLSHTAGIRDGQAYTQSLGRESPPGELLRADSHTAHLPGKGCEYSNFGFGLAGCAVEAQSGLPFQQAMDRFLFEPLGMRAAYYPHLIKAPLADAFRVLPRRLNPNFDGARRQAAPAAGWDQVDAQRHYLQAHGSCCMDVASLALLGRALMAPGLLNEESLSLMRTAHGSLKSRDPHLQQGLGLFILMDRDLTPGPLFGHQGMAYGAVHMIFMDVARRRGIISLTTGASEARAHILADINRDLIKLWASHG